MAFLTDDEVDELGTQMAHASGQSGTQYPLAPSYAPREPTWVDDASGGGYYDDGLGHYSNNGGATWDYTPQPYAAPSYAPQQPAAAPDPYGYDAPYVNEYTAPGEYGNDTYVPPQTDNWGNPQVALADGSNTWSNNVGQLWDSETQSWVDSTQPTALGNYWQQAQDAPSWSDIAQDRAAWSPTREQFIDFDRASDVTSQGPYSRYSLDFGDQSMAAFADDQFGWNGQPKNAYADLPDRYAANNANPSTGILDAFNYLNSTNDIVRSVGGPDLDKLPYGLGYVTDAINPVTLATAGMGAGVPVLGSTFGGNILKRAAGETAVNAAGMYLGEKGAEKAAEYTDNPWLIGAAGLGAGLAGAGGVIAGAKAAKNAPRAIKAVDDALMGLDARIMEPTGTGMGRPVTAGSVVPERVPGELRAGPTMEEAAAAGTAGRAAANPATMTDTELAAAINRADNMVARADTAAEDAVRANGPTAPETIEANRTLAMLEDDAERLRDEAVKRGGVAGLAAKLNDETGAVDMAAIGDMAKAAKPYLAPVAREAGRLVGHAAVGAGVGGATGAYASDGDLGATLRGMAYGAAGGVALRGVGGVAGKAASKGVAQKSAARNAALGIPDAPPATAKLIEIIKAAKPARVSAEELKSLALRKKAAKLHGVYGSNTGEVAFSRAPSVLGGDLPRGQFDAPRPSFTQDDVDSLFNHIAANPIVAGRNKERVFTVFNTQGALFKALAGELPTNGEIQLLEKAFGPELAQALLGKRSLGAKVMSGVLDAVNVPRSLLTALDASAPLRQGALLLGGHPVSSIKAAGTMVRAMASPEFAKYVDEGIAASPNMPIYEKMGLYFAPNSASSPISGREEGIASKLAGRIPGVGGSQRGYTTYLNKLRQGVADGWIKTLSPTELDDDTLLRQMGDWLNIVSGRGKLPPAADRIVSVSSGALFAPRYAISRIQVPIEAIRAVNPISGMKGDVRKEIARDLVSFVGAGVTILALGKASGFWETELDPRSTDFGKIRIGPTRMDFWAGEQQIVRTVAQLAFGERKSTSTGAIIRTDRSDTMLRWLRSKASPAASAAWDLGEGKTFIGEELSADKPTIGKQAFQRTMPLFIQGITEAWMEDGWKAGARASVSGTGVGVQTYFTNRDVANRVAGELFDKPYLDLLKGERDLVDADPRMVEQAAAFSDSGKVNPSQFFDRKDEFYGQLEADFRKKVDAGMEGEALRDAVGDLKGDRWTASQALLGSEAVQKAMKSGTPNSQILDILAEAYWSAPVPQDPKTGNLDFDSRDAERAKIVQQVKDAGFDLNYITGTGLGTFRGKRFEDPVVREAVLKVEAATKQVEDSGYFDLKDKVWAEIAQGDSNLSGFKTYADYRASIEKVVKDDIGDAPSAIVDKIVKKILDNDPATKIYTKINDVSETQWMLEHPKEAVLAYEWGYFTPTEKQRKLIAALQSQNK